MAAEIIDPDKPEVGPPLSLEEALHRLIRAAERAWLHIATHPPKAELGHAVKAAEQALHTHRAKEES